MKNIFQNKYIQVFFVSVFIFFFTYYFLGLFYHNLNQEFLYTLKQQLRLEYKNNTGKTNIDSKISNNSIVVVEIDDATLKKLKFPLDRGDYIPFLKNLSEAKPAVIGFDILFLDPGKDAKKDVLLSQAFKNAGNVIIGADLKEEIKNGVQIIEHPYKLFTEVVESIGFFPPNIDKLTGKAVSVYPFNKYFTAGKIDFYESFSFSILRSYFNHIGKLQDPDFKEISFENQIKETQKGVYKFFDRNIYIPDKKFRINYIEPSNFYTYSFLDIYNGNFKSSDFTNKIVIIGYTAEGVKDEFNLPGIGVTKGVYVHANIVNNVLNKNYIHFFDKQLELFISFLFIAFIVYLNIFYLKHLNLRWIIGGALFLSIFILLVYIILFKQVFTYYGIFLIPNYPLEFFSILLLSFFVSSVLKYLNEDKNKKLLSQALSEYVSKDIANEILHSTGEVKLSGENKRITIFFSDIAGFTTISEKLTPEKLVAFLRVYLGDMSNIILDNKGFINKYEGDAIMALWGVFGEVERFGVIDACKSCLLQQLKLKELNEQWKKEGKDELQVRMGLHTGPAIIGNIGAAGRKMEFTALGDSVNLGSRLEGVNKFYGTNICVSEDIYNEAKDVFLFRYLDKIRVKGKNLGVNIYELISFIGEESNLKKDIITQFAFALDLYFGRKFDEAKVIFSRLSDLGDAPSKVYLKRCEMYIQSPPPGNWDGIWTMDEK